ncbi:SpdD protein [Streptomyces smyrnaeus]|uniref:SpdD protein n=1 Tax=Streptomyces smyrnaeus TaxID=1387713 RepID=A0ABS3Y5B5_9ACTN|nr:SpdD protein [Streptomyces smyrnaeus]MBO8202857.1 SpdD protein [Streptomyces smyrnaeus]
MLLRPQLPPAPNLPATTTHAHEPACSCQHAAPAPRRSLPSVSTGAVGLVLVGGVVLTALLTAVAVSAISVAVAAVVMRSLLNAQRRNR